MISTSRMGLHAAAIALISAHAFGGVPTYELRYLGNGNGAPVGVNDAGEVALTQDARAWLVDAAGTFHLLPVPPGSTSTVARDINADGWVVGYARDSTGATQAMIWRPDGSGGFTSEAVPAPNQAEAVAVNDLGDVVGFVVGGGSFLYNDTQGFVSTISLGFTPLVEEINNERVVIGSTQRMDLDTLVVEDLGLPTGTGWNYTFLALTAQNDFGTVAGRAWVATSQSNFVQAVMYDDVDGWTALNSPLPAAQALDVNAAGDLLASFNHTSHAYLRVAGEGTYLVENLIDPATPGWQLFTTLGGAMSANGTIACRAYHEATGRSGSAVLIPLSADTTFCDAGDGSLASCPCANPGLPDTGCDPAQATGGVRLAATGQSFAPNRATLEADGFPAASTPTAVVIRSGALDPGAPVVFGDGLRCIGTPIVRLAATAAVGGLSVHTFGHGVMAGSGTAWYQVWYRNTPAGFCDPTAAFNLTSGVALDWP